MLTEKELKFAKAIDEGLGCGQVVMGEFVEETALDKSTLERLGSAYTGGMYEAKTCGAVIGAYNILGLLYGTDKETTDQSPDFIRKKFIFDEKFKEKFGSTTCKEILGLDMTNPEDAEEISEKNMFIEFCPKVCSFAVELVKEI